MLRFPRRFAAALGPAVLLAGLAVSGSATANASQTSCPSPIVPGDTVLCGTLADGATYLMEVPPHWNKTLFLYSHGYVAPGSSNPAQDVGDPVTGGWLLSHGYAIAGSSYASTGWAIAQAMPDQIATLNLFDSQIGRPRRTIAWGHSLGGIITAGLIQQYPRRFSAALPMCGVLSGGVATWNTALDAAVAVQQLIDPSAQVVNITNPLANLTGVEQSAAAAQATAEGRARIALAAALADTPGWYTPLSPQPAPNNYSAQEANQYQWDANIDFPFIFAFRAELEARAGGNPSWTTGVNFFRQLAKSADLREVRALYKAAHLNLRADLMKLTRAARITAKPSAVRYLRKNISFNGRIGIPVLTMHTTGDGLVVPENEQAYASVVRRAGRAYLLRQVFVSRAGHCAFTPAETITAARILLRRMRTGHWADHALRPVAMNATATALGPAYNIFLSGGKVVPAGPQFIHYEPALYLRPYDLSYRIHR
ncbi:MAG: alpha/beta hydrolase family protein [Streptosporangiaceae bacterium]